MKNKIIYVTILLFVSIKCIAQYNNHVSINMNTNNFVFLDSIFYKKIKDSNINAHKCMIVFEKSIMRTQKKSIYVKKITVIDTIKRVCKTYNYIYNELSLQTFIEGNKQHYECINKIFDSTNNGIFLQIPNSDTTQVIEKMIQDEYNDYTFYVKYIDNKIVSIVISQYPISCLANERTKFSNEDDTLPNIYYSYFPNLFKKNCSD